MNELALFAGAGGGILGGHLIGWRTVCAVERDAYAAQVLAQRQNDGILRPFPIWSDVTTFDGKPWRGIVDVISGGFPCQDISAAGKGAGIEGERSGLWKEFKRIIGEVRPQYVFVENSPMLTIRGLGTVLGDLAEMGFDAEWGVLGSIHAELPTLRERLFIVASSNGVRLERAWKHTENGADMGRQRLQIPKKTSSFLQQLLQNYDAARIQREFNGMEHSVDRLKAIGNGQVPRVAAAAFTLLSERIGM
jgi:DNA (cytosine-5)-methyltransferase 1